jgi:hypothetical protein
MRNVSIIICLFVPLCFGIGCTNSHGIEDKPGYVHTAHGEVIALSLNDGMYEPLCLRNEFVVKLDPNSELRTQEGLRLGGMIVPTDAAALRFASDGTVSAFVVSGGYQCWWALGSLTLFELADPHHRPKMDNLTFSEIKSFTRQHLSSPFKPVCPVAFAIIRSGTSTFLKKIDYANETAQ